MNREEKEMLRLIRQTLLELAKNPVGGGQGFAMYDVRKNGVRAKLHVRNGKLVHLLIDSEDEITLRAKGRSVPTDGSRRTPQPHKGRLAKRGKTEDDPKN